MKNAILAVAMAMAIAAPAYAQTLSVDEIISLSKTGIGDEAIVAKIRSTETHMDLTVDQMLELKAKGVIPNPIDQNPCAHWRNPMDMMRQG